MDQYALTEEAKLLRNPDLFAVEIDEELVMMDEHSGSYFDINSVGKYLWTLLESPMRLCDLVTALQAQYEVDLAQCRCDIEPFLLSLLKYNLIQLC